MRLRSLLALLLLLLPAASCAAAPPTYYGNVSAATATLGAATATSLNVTGPTTGTSATYSGALTAGGLNVNGVAIGTIAPTYSNTGTPAPSTVHFVYGVCTFNGTSTCAVALSGPAVFSNSNYSCFFGGPPTNSYYEVATASQTTTSFNVINLGYNGTGTGPQIANLVGVVPYTCMGT